LGWWRVGAGPRRARAGGAAAVRWLPLPGYRRAEIRGTLAVEMLVRVGLGAAAAVPMAVGAAWLLDRALAGIFFSVPLVFPAGQIAGAVAPVLGAAALAGLVALRIGRRPLARVLAP